MPPKLASIACASRLKERQHLVVLFSIVRVFHSGLSPLAEKHSCRSHFTFYGRQTPKGPVLFSLLFGPEFMLSSPRIVSSQGALIMEWTTPQHEEIDLNCEISSYANAEL
jgi:hypothetical protein